MNIVKRALKGCMIFALVASTFALPPSSANAQQPSESESITLSPVSRKYNLDAGATVKDKMTIVNDGKLAYDFVVYSRPYSVTNENYDPDFTKPTQNADAYSWVQLDKTRYRIEPGATVTVDYTLRVPEKAAPGGHYGVIFAETQPTDEAVAGNSVARKKRVGMLLYATVNGKVINEGEVLGTDVPFWQQQPPLAATLRVKNDGNTDFIDTTVITVKDVFGNTKYQATKDFTVLPGTTRKINLEWPGASWFGLYKVEIAQTVLGQKSESGGYVLMLPRYIPVLFLVLIIIGGVYAWMRRGKKK